MNAIPPPSSRRPIAAADPPDGELGFHLHEIVQDLEWLRTQARELRARMEAPPEESGSTWDRGNLFRADGVVAALEHDRDHHIMRASALVQALASDRAIVGPSPAAGLARAAAFAPTGDAGAAAIRSSSIEYLEQLDDDLLRALRLARATTAAAEAQPLRITELT